MFADVESVIFDKMKGLNTWRKGDKWADLKIGETVHAMTVEGEAIMFLTVAGVIKGRAIDLMTYHAMPNHGVRCIEIDNQDDAEDHLGGVLELVYNMALEPDDVYTVIYFDHLKTVKAA